MTGDAYAFRNAAMSGNNPLEAVPDAFGSTESAPQNQYDTSGLSDSAREAVELTQDPVNFDISSDKGRQFLTDYLKEQGIQTNS